MIFPWLVHLFTATGAVCAFLALTAGIDGDLKQAFLWLVLSTVIDAVDGALARLARVKERTPYFNGNRLDDIVDYLTFVFVPAAIAVRNGMLPGGPLGVGVAAAILVSSAIAFSRDDAKTSDYFFTGFPSYWNIVVLYLAALRWGPAANAIVLLAFVALVFVRIGYIYPSRTPQLRGLTVTLGIVWGVAIVAMIGMLPTPPAWLVYGSLAYPVYYVFLSLYLHQRRGSNPQIAQTPEIQPR
jgi:phosphatidylcholine synthase